MDKFWLALGYVGFIGGIVIGLAIIIMLFVNQPIGITILTRAVWICPFAIWLGLKSIKSHRKVQNGSADNKQSC